MTQAPTPGPLSGDDVNRECKACGAFKAERDAACTFCGLAPTAPVEASGSELADAVARTKAHRECAHPNHKTMFINIADLDLILSNLRPQPSGETRESGDHTIASAEVQPFEDYPALADHIERMATTGRIGSMIEWDGFLSQLNATILALLSARPLAFGGQQGEDEIAFLLDRLADFENDINERDWYGHVAPAIARVKAALSTTPRRRCRQGQSVACLTRYSPLSTGNNKAMMQEDEAGLYVLRKQALAALKSEGK